RRREAVGLQSELGHERDIFRVPVIVIACHVAVLGADHGTGHAAECVPDRVRTTILVSGALDLIGGSGCAEEHVVRARPGGHRYHPFTAPAMMPLTNCLPATTKRMSRGRVASTAPVSTIE